MIPVCMVFTVALVLCAAVAVVKGDCSGGTISISSTGSASHKHDQATVSFSIKSFHTTSMEKARKDGAEATRRTLGILAAMGVEKRNITTEAIHMQPEYNNNYNNNHGRRQSTLRGYSVSNSLSVKVQNFDMLGDIIDRAVGAAGNDASLNGPHFQLSSKVREQLQHTARIRAVEELGRKAKDIAGAAGCSLGKVMYLSDRIPAAGGGGGGGGGGGFAKSARMAPMMAMESDAGFSSPTPIMNGGDDTVYDTFYGIYELV